jgi:hypothetical protein
MTCVRLRLLLVLTFAVQCLASAAITAQTARTRNDINLPPMSYTCPMHPDVLEGDPGTCPICKMNLVGVRLVSMWTCPVHSVITEPKAGKCPIDRRDLVQVTLAISWTCQGRSDVNQLAPGKCPDGTDTLVKYSPRPHGNHNPQHGGQFFMAPDNWHHLEGALPRPGVVRIYLYDDYSKPLPLDQTKRVQARIVTKETVDPATRTVQEVASPLVLTRDGRFLEARVDNRTFPAQMSAKIKFKADGPEYRFDFVFTSVSKDPVAPAAAPQRAASSPPARGAATSATAASLDGAGSNPDFNATGNPNNQVQVVIPDSIEAMVREVSARNEKIRDLIDKGSFAEIYLPAFEAKEFALAIDEHSGQLSPERRQGADAAIRQLVRSAWLLDAFGDIGNRQQIVDTYAGFQSAVSTLESLFKAAQ